MSMLCRYRAALVAASAALVWLLTPASAGHALPGIEIAAERDGSDYNRARHFGGWIDADGNGLDTRQEVLAAESLIPVEIRGTGVRRVVSGAWYDPFTGTLLTELFRGGYPMVQIDHVVPLAEAWESGASEWTQERRVAFANDLSNPGHLIAVHGPTNGRKGKRDPAEWLPPNESFRCAYVTAWVAIKRTWALSMDPAELAAVRATMETCDERP